MPRNEVERNTRPVSSPNTQWPRAFAYRMIVKESFGDYLRCKAARAEFNAAASEWQEVEGTLDIFVAKGWYLQTTPLFGKTRDGIEYSGLSIEDVATGMKENRQIVPPYEVDDIVYALPFVEGGVGTNAEFAPGGTNAITYIDLNVDGRGWAMLETLPTDPTPCP